MRLPMKEFRKELAKENPADIAVPDEVIKDNSAITMLQQSLTGIRLKLNGLEPKYEDAYKTLKICILMQEIQ